MPDTLLLQQQHYYYESVLLCAVCVRTLVRTIRVRTHTNLLDFSPNLRLKNVPKYRKNSVGIGGGV